MKNESFSLSMELPFPPKIVFEHICAVSKWWSQDFEGSSTKLNDEFVICHPGRHFSKQKLVELSPNKKIVWLVTESELPWLEKDQAEWTNTKMVFELRPKGDITELHFTHEGLVPEKECYSKCSQGWEMVIKEKLYNFITQEGSGRVFL